MRICPYILRLTVANRIIIFLLETQVGFFSILTWWRSWVYTRKSDKALVFPAAHTHFMPPLRGAGEQGSRGGDVKSLALAATPLFIVRRGRERTHFTCRQEEKKWYCSGRVGTIPILTTTWWEFACPANQHPKSTIKKKAHIPLRTSWISQTNVSAMFDDHKILLFSL